MNKLTFNPEEGTLYYKSKYLGFIAMDVDGTFYYYPTKECGGMTWYFLQEVAEIVKKLEDEFEHKMKQNDAN